MNPIFQQILYSSTQKEDSVHSNKRRNKENNFLHFKFPITRYLKDTFLISIGILSAGFGLEAFLLPNSFIDGGVTGISLLTTEITKIPLALLIVLLNIPFVLLGYTQIGKSFALKSTIAIAGLALAITLIPFPVITSDKLLIAVFGGFFIGAGIGFTMRGGGVLDGTEVLAIYLGKRTGLTIGDIMLLLNIVIFAFAAYLLSIESALYSILTYLSASKTVDFVIAGIEEYTGVTIVTDKSDEIRSMIIEKLGRGVTLISGKRGFGKRGENLNRTDIVYTVVTRLEIANLQAEVDKIDPIAFMVMTAIKDTKGGMIKKRPLSHA